MFPSRKLYFFISSTGDLKAERASVQESLRLFEIDGLRFEEWPSMPQDPMEICLEGVQSADAVVLLLGASYGTPDKDGLSGTHQEFRHACKISRPIFAFLLKSAERDPRQIEFIAEVQRAVFRCHEIASINELAQSLRISVAAEFSRRWKHFERHPPESSSPWGEPAATAPISVLSSRDDMLAELKKRYADGEDDAISAAADTILARYPKDSELLNIIFQSAVDEGILNRPVNRTRVEAAVELWRHDRPIEPMAKAGRLYCLGNALHVLKRYDEAIATYRESLEVHPNFAECWKNLGSTYHDRGDHEQGSHCVRKSIENRAAKIRGALQPRYATNQTSR